jgi:farnesyl diphosphate synthase
LSRQLDLELFSMTTGTALANFAKRLDQTAEDTEALLAKLLSDALLPDEIARPKRLIDAMRYSSLGGGKRLRPFLVVESSAVFGVAREAALLAGAGGRSSGRRRTRMHPLLFADP